MAVLFVRLKTRCSNICFLWAKQFHLFLNYNSKLNIFLLSHVGRNSGDMEDEFKEFENQTDDSLMSEAEKVKLEVLNGVNIVT